MSGIINAVHLYLADLDDQWLRPCPVLFLDRNALSESCPVLFLGIRTAIERAGSLCALAVATLSHARPHAGERRGVRLQCQRTAHDGTGTRSFGCPVKGRPTNPRAALLIAVATKRKRERETLARRKARSQSACFIDDYTVLSQWLSESVKYHLLVTNWSV